MARATIAHSQAGYTSAVVPVTEKRCWHHRRSPCTPYVLPWQPRIQR